MKSMARWWTFRAEEAEKALDKVGSIARPGAVQRAIECWLKAEAYAIDQTTRANARHRASLMALELHRVLSVPESASLRLA